MRPALRGRAAAGPRPARSRGARRLRLAPALGLLLPLLALACAGSRTPEVAPGRQGGVERGLASWYGSPFHGRPTASGEIYDMHRLTAAHRSLPFGSVVEVRNLDNGRTVEVRINDRGPFVKGRVIDLSYTAARELGMIGPGIARVEVRILPLGSVLADASRYTVQVGAFREVQRAEALLRELQGTYPEVRLESDGTWTRVHVGLFKRRREAEKLAGKLLRIGFAALVVASPARGSP